MRLSGTGFLRDTVQSLCFGEAQNGEIRAEKAVRKMDFERNLSRITLLARAKRDN